MLVFLLCTKCVCGIKKKQTNLNLEVENLNRKGNMESGNRKEKRRKTKRVG
jgi:hypothetical protein